MNLQTNDTDAPEFISHVTRLIGAVAISTPSARVIVVKLDNWFGPKWLAFSHKAMGAFGVVCQELVVPPFSPNRIQLETAFTQTAPGEYAVSGTDGPVHTTQSSNANTTRKLSTLFPDTSLFWWSGRSAINGRGAVMTYLHGSDGHRPWYLELNEASGWGPSVLKGLSGVELAHWLDIETNP